MCVRRCVCVNVALSASGCLHGRVSMSVCLNLFVCTRARTCAYGCVCNFACLFILHDYAMMCMSIRTPLYVHMLV